MTTLTSRSLPLIPLPLSIVLAAKDKLQENLMVPNHHNLLSPTGGLHPSAIISASPKSECLSPDYELIHQQRKMVSPSDMIALKLKSLANTSACSAMMDDDSDVRSSSVSSYQMNGSMKMHDHANDGDIDDDDDHMSRCSDDSELSVGKESEQNFNHRGVRHLNASAADDSVLDKISVNSLNRFGAILDDDKNDTCASDEMMSNKSSPQISLPPNSPRDELMQRLPIIRPSPTRLQEEFLRNSQLYAEELMKRQMSFMAATRGLTINPKVQPPSATDHPFGFPAGLLPGDVAACNNSPIRMDEPKIGFRPHVKNGVSDKDNRWIEDRNSCSPESMSNFRGIHSHLNAISKITSALTCADNNNQKLRSPNSLTSREGSQSPPNHNSNNNNILQNHHLHHHHHHHLMNNNMNESNLKFSIDNILKADFGRRITDPLKIRKSSSKKQSQRSNNNNNNNNCDKPQRNAAGNPVDLTPASASVGGVATGIPAASPSASGAGPPNDKDSAASNPAATSASSSSTMTSSSSSSSSGDGGPMVWPAWVYCTRYSDRPSSGPRTRRPKKPPSEKGNNSGDEKRPRTAFSGPQLARLKHEFSENRYLTERRRQQLSGELGLNEAQIKIWFQNKRAKIKKASGQKNPLALQLMAQGLYNHSTVPLTREEEEMQEMQANANV